jgi:hypothetical protein
VPGEFLDGLRWRAAHGEMAAKGVAQHVSSASFAHHTALGVDAL